MQKPLKTGALIFTGLIFGTVTSNALAFHATDANIQNGRKLYNQTCVACHGKSGEGSVPGTPDFTKSDGRLSKSNEVLLDHTKNGFRTPGSRQMAMPSKGGNPSLNDQDIRDIIAYMHETFR